MEFLLYQSLKAVPPGDTLNVTVSSHAGQHCPGSSKQQNYISYHKHSFVACKVGLVIHKFHGDFVSMTFYDICKRRHRVLASAKPEKGGEDGDRKVGKTLHTVNPALFFKRHCMYPNICCIK
jgi:hypothetical protein